MSQPTVAAEVSAPVKLSLRAAQLTEEQFVRLCQENRDLRLELTADKELVIMPPTGSETGWCNNEISYSLTAWTKKDGTGLAFNSSTGFTLPNGAIRSPDAAWVRRARWDALTGDQRKKFAPLCPEFVVELRSPADSLSAVQEKMQEYMANGAQLGWLIDPIDRRVYVYRPGQPVAVLDDPATLSGDPILPGFVLLVHELW